MIFMHSSFFYTTGATSEAGTAYPSRAPEFTPQLLMGFTLLDL